MSKMKKGAVMMEYAMVCVLVAAASAVAFWYFGRSVQNTMAAASMAVATAEEAAQKQITSNRTAQEKVYAAIYNSASAYIAAANEAELGTVIYGNGDLAN